jgi:hypothetical protein
MGESRSGSGRWLPMKSWTSSIMNGDDSGFVLTVCSPGLHKKERADHVSNSAIGMMAAARVRRRYHITIGRGVGLTPAGAGRLGIARKLPIRPKLELSSSWHSGDIRAKRAAAGRLK